MRLPRRSSPPSTILDAAREARSFQFRALFAFVVVCVLAVTLLARLAYLQVFAFEHFKTLSDDNRVKVAAVAPTRGRIFDRNGIVLAENIPTFSLEVVRESVDDLETLLDRLSSLVSISDSDRARFRRLLRVAPRFEPVPIRVNLTEEEVARISVNTHAFPGVEVHARLTRHYPLGSVGAHLIGYVGRINEKELRRLDGSNYRGTTHIGKTGIERAYETLLHGRVGYEHVEINAEGRVLRVLERKDPVPGRNLYLNVDSKLQAVSEATLGDSNGAIVVIEPASGAVLAMVSTPTFDPNLFVNGIEPDDYRALLKSPNRPLYNRALKGQYPPGSTIKPFLGLAGLELGVDHASKRSWCPGWFSLPGHSHRYRDWKRGGHGFVNISRSIIESCDVFYYELAIALGIGRMHEFLANFDFGRKTGIDLTGERRGLNPSPQWKRRVRKEPWYPGETLIAGIGQGFHLATPLQLANATAILAAGGRKVTPRVAMRSEDPISRQSVPIHSDLRMPVAVRNTANWQRIVDSMESVVHGNRGTARRISTDLSYRMAGKTGTAQVFTLGQDETYDEENIKKKLRDHGLFIAFAPVVSPRLSVAIIVENGGSGSRSAAPVAREIFDAYFGTKSPDPGREESNLITAMSGSRGQR